MASAAAVAADHARSPIPSNIGEPDGISSAVFPSDAKVPDNLDDDDEEDDDDVVRSRPRGAHMNGGAEEEALDDDLFGDGDDAEEDEDAPSKYRTLDDEDLDSGDDDGREDRTGYAADEEQQQEYEQQEQVLMETTLGRIPVPEPSDGEMYLTKVPRFLSIDPKAWHFSSYQPPTTDHHSTTAGPQFSAYNTAMSTVHWRKSPSNPQVNQSNARVLRWSDGSFTLQFASNPTQQFTVEGNPVAPRQQNPKIPTPTSFKPGQKDAPELFTYLTIPDNANEVVRIAHKITAGLSILPSAETTDEALTKLQNSLAAIAQGKNKTAGGGIELAPVTEDPDLARQKAEVAEREKARAQKRREAAEARERDRGGRGMGRSRAGGYGGGLSIGMLEDEELGGGTRQRASKPKQNRRQRRNSEYSDDEDFGNKRGNFANDEYDEEDEFIARSDEEEAVASSDDDDDGIEEPSRSSKGNKRPSPDAEEDEDAEGEDEVDVVQTARVKRRRVVDDDDE